MTSREFRTTREALGLTQHQVAVGLGVDPRTVTRWEDGTTPVPQTSAAMLTLLAKFDLNRRLKALVHGAQPDDDPIGDLVGEYDQRVENLRALRVGRAAQVIPPARDRGERRPEGVLKTASEDADPIRAEDYDKRVRELRKRGGEPRVAAKAIDADDPIGDMVANHDERVAELRAAKAKERDGA